MMMETLGDLKSGWFLRGLAQKRLALLLALIFQTRHDNVCTNGDQQRKSQVNNKSLPSCDRIVIFFCAIFFLLFFAKKFYFLPISRCRKVCSIFHVGVKFGLNCASLICLLVPFSSAECAGVGFGWNPRQQGRGVCHQWQNCLSQRFANDDRICKLLTYYEMQVLMVFANFRPILS